MVTTGNTSGAPGSVGSSALYSRWVTRGDPAGDGTMAVARSLNNAHKESPTEQPTHNGGNPNPSPANRSKACLLVDTALLLLLPLAGLPTVGEPRGGKPLDGLV